MALLIGNAFPAQPLTAQSLDSEDSRFLIDNFEDDSIGSLPAEWYERNGEIKLLDLSKKDQEKFKYRVLEERGNKYLKYEGIQAKHINYPLADKSAIDIYETPVLSWKARAWELPENANEESDSRNDAVMSLYVVFDFGRVALVKKVPKSIRYTWSTTLEKGSEHSRLFGNQKIVVVESGRDRVGEWVTFERNIVEDYRRLYGDDPPAKPLALLILSDGDSTDSKAEADYDDIQLKQRSQPTGNTD
ncbi:MAG: DUF3047 domain-containing protein [Balneolaceae bacterium]|nr:DUF3047 domain-containing protein [Balneolaceae bacterium]